MRLDRMVRFTMAMTAFPATQVRRLLLTGKHAGTFQCNARVEAQDFEDFLRELLQAGHGHAICDLITQARSKNLAAKPDVLIIACAMIAASDDPAARKRAWEVFGEIVWTGTQLFTFMHHYHRHWKGHWGRTPRACVSGWYQNRSPVALAKQITQYSSRVIHGNRWTHKDVLRLCHFRPDPATDPARHLVIGYAHRGRAARKIVDGDSDIDTCGFLRAVEHLSVETNEKTIVGLIERHGLQQDHVPTELLTNPAVWRALFLQMKPVAVLRNLGRTTSMGLIDDTRVRAHLVAMLSAPQAAVLHPFNVFIAKLAYETGRSRNLTWQPNKFVITTLSTLFEDQLDVPEDSDYVAVPPGGTVRRVLQAVDMSGSMMFGALAGSYGASLRQAAAGLAFVGAKRSSDEVVTAGFATELVDIPQLTAAKSLAQVATAIDAVQDGACDLVLLIDLTASMTPWLRASVRYLTEVIELARRGFRTPGALRVGLVGYRDFAGSNDPSTQRRPQCSPDQYVVVEPTAEIDCVVTALRDQHASGGNDIPEDVAGALDKVAQLDWRQDAQRLVVHIADAPPHGTQFHDETLHDDYPNGDPFMRDPVAILRTLATEGCDYVLVDCAVDKHKAAMAQTAREFAKAFEGTAGAMEFVLASRENTGRFTQVMMEAMERSFFGGGTAASCVIRTPRVEGSKFDCFIVYTDDPSDQLEALHTELMLYRANVAPARLVVVALAGVGTPERVSGAVAQCPHTLIIDGFAPDMVSVIDAFAQGGA